MKTMKATRQQKKRFRKLARRWRFAHPERVHIVPGNLFVLPTGETFLQFGILRLSRMENRLPIRGYTLFALPLNRLAETDLDLYSLPRAEFDVFPSSWGMEGYPFKRAVQAHLAAEYARHADEQLCSVEVVEVYTGDYAGKGLGSHLLRHGSRKLDFLCFNEQLYVTHLFGELIPGDEHRLEDVQRFFKRNGFRRKTCYVYRLL